MSILRLFGGLTPGDGEDPRTFPVIFNVVADLVEANESGLVSQGSRLLTAESDIDALEAKNPPAFSAVAPTDGQVPVFDAAEGVFVPGEGGGLPINAFAFVETVYFESNGTFEKGDFPFLRAVRVKCQGGGGAGSGDTGGAGGKSGGGGGGYAESFITDISGLSASETVTVGAGGTGGTGNGGSGGDSSFGSFVSANGGGGAGVAGGNGGLATLADLGAGGSGGGAGSAGNGPPFVGGAGGGSHFGGGGAGRVSSGNQGGLSGREYGGGGSGAISASTAQNGGDGADGIVIVELFA